MAVFAVLLFAGGGLVVWNLFGQGPYGDSCSYSFGCKSFMCVHHGLRHEAPMNGPGRCTKSCDSDADCGAGAKCVVLDDATRDDLPPFGKPDRACLAELDAAEPS